jgi:hypothetical protein
VAARLNGSEGFFENALLFSFEMRAHFSEANR